MTLSLRVPATADEPDPTVETRAVYVEEWVEGLPYADPVALLRVLHGALSDLNKCPLRPGRRVELLELYLRPYEYILTLTRDHGAIHTIAAFEQRRAQTDATRRIATELAYGYKLALADLLSAIDPGELPRLRGRRARALAGPLQRAVLSLRHVLAHSFHEYLPTPAHVWSELGALYEFAAEHGIAGAPNPSAALPAQLGAPTEHHYKVALLVGLVDPYHLPYGRIWDIIGYFEQAAGRATLEPARAAEKPAGVFHVDPLADRRPVPYSALPTSGYILNARPLLGHLQQSLTDRDAAREPRSLEQRLAEHVLSALGRPPRRMSERQPASEQIWVATGLATVHYFVRTRGTAPPPSPEELDSIEIGDVEPGEQTDFGRHTYVAEYWELTNRSGHGVGVVKHVRPNQPVGVGEVLGLRSRAEKASWVPGIVRWLNVANGGEYQAGVELIGTRLLAVRLRAEGEKASPDGIVALEVPGESEEATLVAPIGTFSAGRSLLLERFDGITRVTCTRLIESLRVVERFAIEL